MKIYRVSEHDAHGESQGYSYHTSKAVAERYKREWEKKTKGSIQEEEEIQEFEIELNKTSVLEFLNTHCSYPDNG